MPNKGLRKFQKTVAAQVAAFPKDYLVEKVTDEKIIALTFDDGPDPRMTPRLLRILRDHEARATFFLVGERAERYPGLVRDIKTAGHAIGGHGYEHIDHRKLSAAHGFRDQAGKTERLLAGILGKAAGYFRPPYGAVTNEQVKLFAERGIKTVLWSVDSLDWDRAHAKQSLIEKRVLEQAHPGAVVLLHSGAARTATAEALPTILKALKRRGYRFVSVEEMFSLASPETPVRQAPTSP